MVYTNAAGQQFYAGGSFSNFLTMNASQKQSLGNIAQAELAHASNGTILSPFGSLITITGTVNDANQQAYGNTWLKTTDPVTGVTTTNPSTVLTTGANLSQQWSTITNAMLQINGYTSFDFIKYPSSYEDNNSKATFVVTFCIYFKFKNRIRTSARGKGHLCTCIKFKYA